MKYIFYGIALTAFLFSACGQSDPNAAPKKELDTPTTGEITIMVDEGYRPIIESSIDVFDSIYRRAKINALYVSEAEAVKALLEDSMEVIIITRSLKEDEMAYFKSRGFTPRITPIAHDAVAFVVNPANRDTLLTIAELRGMLDGSIKSWKQINPQSGLGEIRLVFDHAGSGTVRYCRDTIAGGAPLTAQASALNTNTEVIEYVAKNKNAIGIISANWISDTDDGGTQRFLKEIQLVDVALDENSEGWGPYQAYVAQGRYPFKRTVQVVNCQARAGLGLGFAAFLAGDAGQRIVMKDGLLAANVPIRLIQIKR